LVGHSPSQLAKCFSLGKASKSTPTSAMTLCAICTSIPSTCVQSTPVIRYSSVRRSNFGALPRARLPFGHLVCYVRRIPHSCAREDLETAILLGLEHGCDTTTVWNARPENQRTGTAGASGSSQSSFCCSFISRRARPPLPRRVSSAKT
jgi:hypothetical protein